MSWPRATGQIPVFFGERNGGRPFNPADHYTSKYLDSENTPLFVFGHGLGYGRFAFSNLRLSGATLAQSGTLAVSVDVVNDGARAAEETVFLFSHDKVASVTRPLLELKGFAKIALEPGVRGSVTLKLKGTDLRFPGPDMTPLFEPGDVEILLGPAPTGRGCWRSRSGWWRTPDQDGPVKTSLDQRGRWARPTRAALPTT